ncbi:tyrosine-type recombinase/integrase [Halopseudomonas pelagia]|nr:integrase arm-type DNA-binding domain-containing protein [Halopseudomonas pelagia]
MSKLSIKKIEKIMKIGDRGLTSDGGGLYLKVSKQGSGSWIFRYKNSGKSRDMGLGSFPEISLASARNQAFLARQLRERGLDPIEERAKADAIAEDALSEGMHRKQSFKTLTEQYITNHSPAWRNDKHRSQWANTMNSYAFPVIGQLAPNEIKTSHLMEILSPIWITKTETASRVRNRIELVLDFAKALGCPLETNPARWRGHLDKLLPKRSKVAPVNHHSAASWNEMQPIALDLQGREAPSFQALLMTILTACRTSEVLNARWDEIDWEERIWTIPSNRMKAGKLHRVPIVPHLEHLLINMNNRRESDYIFPGNTKDKPLSNMAMTMALRRIERDDITVHGFAYSGERDRSFR